MKNVNNEAEKKEIKKYIYICIENGRAPVLRPCCFSPKRTLKVFQVFASCLIMSGAFRADCCGKALRLWKHSSFARTVSPLYSSHFNKWRLAAYGAGFLKRHRPSKSPRRGLIHTHVLYKGLIRPGFFYFPPPCTFKGFDGQVAVASTSSPEVESWLRRSDCSQAALHG